MRMSSFIVNLMESGGFIMECGQYINVDNIYIDDIWRYNTIQFVNGIVECMRYVWRNGAAKWG